ncbi:chemotaxis protein CheW [Desulfohalobiaceae bacterium Ax17]|uniref:chemotaxis protein CheW n=1 Tax=Desulfovulcanus ferrireducens TaxID=2831190 RepID=UPI00207BCD5B|nr:chemotaxis protein CheW [Desulfovulcanus ferrireducens]MBT8763076.1 chemotaxis protein CheW [Desulfovulcanus ferrireducens]
MAMQATKMSADHSPPEGEGLDLIEAEDLNQYITFYIGKECFAFPMHTVLEIIWVPETVSVPLTPASLMGLANLRGTVLPVLDLRLNLGLPASELTETSRVIIIDSGHPIGLVVDRVDRVLSVEPDKIEDVDSVQSTVRVELLSGVVKDVGGHSLIQLLDVRSLIQKEFSSLLEEADSEVQKRESQGFIERKESEEEENDSARQLVSFFLDNQEYAFEISELKEIVRVPEEINHVPQTDPHVLGLINFRHQMLPLVSLRRMFGLTNAEVDESNRILVVTLDNGAVRRPQTVGIVVDRVQEVLYVAEEDWEQMPGLLANSGELDEIKAVCRLNGGKRLISVLSAKNLFQHPAMQAAVETGQEFEDGEEEMRTADLNQQNTEDEEIQLVVFQLADQEYGVMIDAIQEIILIPEEMNVVPKTPDFIEGMINLRGTVLPVIDMRKRFGLKAIERKDSQRIIVFNIDGLRSGFIVDAVSEVLRIPSQVIEDSPKLSADQARIMGKVANLKDQNRMILILDVSKLLDEQEVSELADVNEENKEPEALAGS